MAAKAASPPKLSSSQNYAVIRMNKSLLSQFHKERLKRGSFVLKEEATTYKAVLSRYVNYELENLCLRIDSNSARFKVVNDLAKKLTTDTEGILSALDKGEIKLDINKDILALMSSPEKMKSLVVEEHPLYDYHKPYRRSYYKIDEYLVLYEKLSIRRFDSELIGGLYYKIMNLDYVFENTLPQEFNDVMVALYGLEDAEMIYSNERNIE